MTIVVLAADEQWEEITANTTDIQWLKAAQNFSFTDYAHADAFIILKENNVLNFTATTKPVFINSVTATLTALHAPNNVLRINGWATFLQRHVWEIAGTITDNSKAVIEKLQKKVHVIKDEPGLVSAKIIAMIINEAYFALGEAVSTKAEIDTAMKLGTNYPYGPFEWAQKIGIENIFALLQKLTLTNKRYLPAPLLINEASIWA
jgi:3-hydroxybutyryl-CoA dehydrogenase